MSSDLMDTEVGGEQTQYESIQTTQQPSKKSGGQLGEPETTSDPSSTETSAAQRAERGEKTAENIRYGQAISENGMGGQTVGQTGEVGSEGFGGVSDERPQERDNSQERAAEGYGEGNDVGA